MAPLNQKLTTQEAADILGISRPTLVKLLDEHELPFERPWARSARDARRATTEVPRFAAVLDACVLVPVTLTDTLLRLAEAGLYRPIWTGQIQNEARAAICRIRPDADPSQIDARFHAMNVSFEGAFIQGWENYLDVTELSDENDRQVVAAVRSYAGVIVTENLRDFPEGKLATVGVEAISLDDFLLDLLGLAPGSAISVIGRQARDKRRPPLDVEDVLLRLERSGAPSSPHRSGRCRRAEVVCRLRAAG